MTDQEKEAFKDSFRKKHKDEFVNVLGKFIFCHGHPKYGSSSPFSEFLTPANNIWI